MYKESYLLGYQSAMEKLGVSPRLALKVADAVIEKIAQGSSVRPGFSYAPPQRTAPQTPQGGGSSSSLGSNWVQTGMRSTPEARAAISRNSANKPGILSSIGSNFRQGVQTLRNFF